MEHQIVYVVSGRLITGTYYYGNIGVLSNISLLPKLLEDYFGKFTTIREEIVEDSGIDRYLTILDSHNEKYKIVVEDFELLK
jgi:hypothetical protein